MLGRECYNLPAMSLILILKIAIVLLFLVMFVRRPSLPWGVGLLTVSTAVLLDTILGTFDREALLIQLGFFFYVIAGMLVGGAAFWLLGLLGPHLGLRTPAAPEANTAVAGTIVPDEPVAFAPVTDEAGTVYDLQMIYTDMQQRLGREDLLDLMFDLEMPETILLAADANGSDPARAIVTAAQADGRVGQLALAVERILTPPAAETLPRLEKITPDSPRPILRYYLLAHTDLVALQAMAAQLDVDWEQLPGSGKNSKTRELLLYLYRRNRVDELLTLLQNEEGDTAVTPPPEAPT